VYLSQAFDPLSQSSVMRDERGQLDASFSYDINEHFNVYLNGINLTNETKMDYVTDITRLRNYSEYGRRYQLGFRWKLR
jgi:iron complex outermembrane receptor protein